MSKIYDVEKMYGQDFSIVTTNAPSNIIKNTKKLLPNTLLISSPKEDGQDEDNNMPSIFATDYNGDPLQLTYSFYMKNGLNYHENGYVYLNIDNSTIITDNLNSNGKLKVETNNLTNATFKNKGVVKLSNTLQNIDRNLENSIYSKYNKSTFITVNNDGILYIHNDLLDLINDIVDFKIKQKLDSIKVMLNNNLKMWIYITSINNDKYNSIYNINANENPINIDENTPVSFTFDLYFLSFNNEAEIVDIQDKNNKVYKIDFENDQPLTQVTKLQDNDELYQHCLKNITITFLPNYYIENNEINKQNLILSINIGNDQSENLIFQQKKLDSNINISINNNSISVNEILNSNKWDITEDIDFGPIKNIELNGTRISNYQIHTFISNNKNNNNYNLFDIYDYEITNDNTISFKLENESESDGTNSKLYKFIKAIIKTNNTDNNDIYELEDIIQVNENELAEKLSNFIYQVIENNTNKYKLNLGTEIILSTNNNTDLGKFIQIIPIELNLDKISFYGYIFINKNNNDNSTGDNLVPKHIYYKSRSGNINYDLLNKDGYAGQNINTLTLNCIWDDSFLNQNNNNSINLHIKYNSFKKYDIINNNDEVIDNNSTNIQFIYNTNNINEITNDNNTLNITIPQEKILNMLYDGLTFDINYYPESNKSSVKSQTVIMNINMLQILLSKMKFIINNNAETNVTVRNLLSDYYSLPDYYNMNNYVITGINNNQIKDIKIDELPSSILSLLSDSNNNFYIHLYFYVISNNESSIQKRTIRFYKNGSNILLKLDNNNNNNNTIISTNVSNNTYTINSIDGDSFLPKLLMIGFSINEKDSKLCYIQNTYSCNGGLITQDQKSNQMQQVYNYNDSNKLYEIIGVINTDNTNQNDSLFIKSLLKKKTNNDFNIEVNPLDLTGLNVEFNDGLNNSSSQTFDLLIDNNVNYDNAQINTLYNVKFEYNYLINPNRELDKYNIYSGTPINGGTQITPSGYQIRFNKVVLKLNESTNQLNNTGYYIYGNNIYINNYNNLLTIYQINNSNSNNYTIDNLFKIIFSFKINDNNSTVGLDKIKLDNLESVEIHSIETNKEYKLLLDNYILNGTTINDLSLGYNIKYYNVSWLGLKYNNNHITDQIALSAVDNNYDSILNNLTAERVTLQYGANDYDVTFEINGTSTTSFDEVKKYIRDKFHQGISSEETLEYDVYWVHGSIKIPLLPIDNNLLPNKLKFKLIPNITYDNIPDGKLNILDNNNTQIVDIIINRENTSDVIFKIKYDQDYISNINIQQKDINNSYQNDIPFIKDDEIISVNNVICTYKLNGTLEDGHYHNNTDYNIIIIAKGNTNSNQKYSDRTFVKSAYIRIVQKNEYTDFGWNGPAITTPITEINPSDIENKLQTLNLPAGISYNQVTYSISAKEYDPEKLTAQEAVSFIPTNDNQICFVAGHKHITIHDGAKGKGLIKYKIAATLEGDNDHLTTTRESYIWIDIPADSAQEPEPENQSGE